MLSGLLLPPESLSYARATTIIGSSSHLLYLYLGLTPIESNHEVVVPATGTRSTYVGWLPGFPSAGGAERKGQKGCQCWLS